MGEPCRDGAGDGNAHAGEPVGDDAGVGVFAAEHAGHPQFMGAHVADHDVFQIQRGAQVPDDLLGFHGKVEIVVMAVHVLDEGGA